MELTHLEKILFPKIKATKEQVIDYYTQVAPLMLPHLRGRPLILQRYPNGVAKEGFFEQNPFDWFPDWVRTIQVERGKGKPNQAMTCHSLKSLLFYANIDAIAFHTWLSTEKKLNCPDKLILDLDPSSSDFKPVIQVARVTREIFQELGFDPFLMTTGGKGVHLVLPLRADLEFEQVRDCAKAIATQVCERLPDLATMELRKNKRGGKVFVDALRNAYGHSAIAPYSLRAHPTAPTATPIFWEELGKLRNGSATFNLSNLPKRLKQKEDPWADFSRSRISPKRLLKLLELD